MTLLQVMMLLCEVTTNAAVMMLFDLMSTVVFGNDSFHFHEPKPQCADIRHMSFTDPNGMHQNPNPNSDPNLNWDLPDRCGYLALACMPT